MRDRSSSDLVQTELPIQGWRARLESWRWEPGCTGETNGEEDPHFRGNRGSNPSSLLPGSGMRAYSALVVGTSPKGGTRGALELTLFHGCYSTSPVISTDDAVFGNMFARCFSVESSASRLASETKPESFQSIQRVDAMRSPWWFECKRFLHFLFVGGWDRCSV